MAIMMLGFLESLAARNDHVTQCMERLCFPHKRCGWMVWLCFLNWIHSVLDTGIYLSLKNNLGIAEKCETAVSGKGKI